MVGKESSYSLEREKYNVTSALLEAREGTRAIDLGAKLYRKGGFISFAPSESAWFGLETRFIYLK